MYCTQFCDLQFLPHSLPELWHFSILWHGWVLHPTLHVSSLQFHMCTEYIIIYSADTTSKKFISVCLFSKSLVPTQQFHQRIMRKILFFFCGNNWTKCLNYIFLPLLRFNESIFLEFIYLGYHCITISTWTAFTVRVEASLFDIFLFQYLLIIRIRVFS